MAENKFDGIAKFLHTIGSVVVLIAVIYYLIFCRSTLDAADEAIEALRGRRLIAYGLGGLGLLLVVLGFLSGMLSGMSQTPKRPPGQPAPPQQNPPGTPPGAAR